MLAKCRNTNSHSKVYQVTIYKSVKIKVINVATQKGNTDCGLYAVAMMTSIAYKEAPVNVIYSQADRIYLQQCFDKRFFQSPRKDV